ncbi:MAG: HAMP domain-containing protein [Candidatus Omnitrophica bacterium]|nr:HAMP domain-containing protein [Candidatus Omnitrophota bacterium]
MPTKSIYFRMTFWYVLAVGLIAGILSACLYANFSRVLNKDFNLLLESRAEDIAQVIDAAMLDRDRDSLAGIKSEQTNADFLNTLRNALEWSRGSGIYIQVFQPDGSVMIASRARPFPQILPRVVAGIKKNRFFDSPGRVVPKSEEVWPVRTLVRPIDKNGAEYFVQVSASLRPLYVKLRRIKTVLLIFLPSAMFLVTVMGFFLTRTTLSPVDEMTKAMRQITSRNLKQRIKMPAVNDETKRLAETFNDMLGRLDKAFSLQQQLIQDVSHELRTPLTALKGKQEVALNKQRSVEEYEAILAVNLEEIDKMNALVENLLDLAQLDRVEYELNIEKVDLMDLTRQIIDAARPVAEQKRITLRLLTSDAVAIEADIRQIERVLTNIIDNALKYTPAEGAVALRVSRRAGHVVLTVNDTGPGIAPEELGRVFDRFYRAEKSRTSPGFGLGLSIAKSVVTAHKGTIRVESAVGQGATFIVSLPLRQS